MGRRPQASDAGVQQFTPVHASWSAVVELRRVTSLVLTMQHYRNAEDVVAHAEWQVVTDIADDTIGIRSLDWDRDRFDIEFGCAAVCPLLTPQQVLLLCPQRGLVTSISPL